MITVITHLARSAFSLQATHTLLKGNRRTKPEGRF
jgi:hypothetical protein